MTNYSRFEHIDSDEDEPDNAASERRKLEAAADAIPPVLREALAKLQIATDTGDDDGAKHARNSMAQMIRELPNLERPKVMEAIQRVVVGTGSARAQAAATSSTKVPAMPKPAPAKPKQAPATQKQAPTMPKPALATPKQPEAAISPDGDVEIAGVGSKEDAREQLSQSLRELEAAQKMLAALEPSDTVCVQDSNLRPFTTSACVRGCCCYCYCPAEQRAIEPAADVLPRSSLLALTARAAGMDGRLWRLAGGHGDGGGVGRPATGAAGAC